MMVVLVYIPSKDRSRQGPWSLADEKGFREPKVTGKGMRMGK